MIRIARATVRRPDLDDLLEETAELEARCRALHESAEMLRHPYLTAEEVRRVQIAMNKAGQAAAALHAVGMSLANLKPDTEA